MLVKKLITLACAIGILACGACFLPPPRMHTPPPPVSPNLRGISRIRVVASNTSPAQHVDAAQLSIWLASQISVQAREAKITGFSAQQAANEDAVLEVIILSESATPLPGTNPGDEQNWELRLSLTAVLTRTDGQVAWRESNGDYTASRLLAREPEPDVWKEPIVQGWLTRGVGNRLVYRMLNAH